MGVMTPLQKQMIDYIDNARCNFDTAVSLTFSVEPYDCGQASGNFTWFIKKLNDQIHGNNWHRRVRHTPLAQIPVIPILESDRGTKRLHYHCAMEKPETLNDWQFETLINLLWSQSRLGGKSNNAIEPVNSRLGWYRYMTKEMGGSNTDIIDVINMHRY